MEVKNRKIIPGPMHHEMSQKKSPKCKNMTEPNFDQVVSNLD